MLLFNLEEEYCMKQSTKTTLQIGNLAAVIVMIIANMLAVILPLNGKTTQELSDALPNYFVPAGLIFSIWGVIYVLQVLFAIYQARGLGSNKVVEMPFLERIGPFSIVANLANTAWIFAWQWQLVPLSLPIMIVLLVALLVMYVRLGIGLQGTAVSRRDWWFVHLPTSVYLGWISVATVANVTAVLVNAGVPSFDTAAVAWTIIILAVVGVLAVLMLITRRDLFYVLVIEWALFGIALKQAATISIFITTIIAMIVVWVFWFAVLVKIFRTRK